MSIPTLQSPKDTFLSEILIYLCILLYIPSNWKTPGLKDSRYFSWKFAGSTSLTELCSLYSFLRFWYLLVQAYLFFFFFLRFQKVVWEPVLGWTRVLSMWCCKESIASFVEKIFSSTAVTPFEEDPLLCIDDTVQGLSSHSGRQSCPNHFTCSLAPTAKIICFWLANQALPLELRT